MERARKAAEIEVRLANFERHRANLAAVLTQSRRVDSAATRLQQRHLDRAEAQIARLRQALRLRQAPSKSG